MTALTHEVDELLSFDRARPFDPHRDYDERLETERDEAQAAVKDVFKAKLRMATREKAGDLLVQARDQEKPGSAKLDDLQKAWELPMPNYNVKQWWLDGKWQGYTVSSTDADVLRHAREAFARSGIGGMNCDGESMIVDGDDEFHCVHFYTDEREGI